MNKFIKWGLILLACGVVLGVSAYTIIMFTPHRDVQATPTDFKISAKTLVHETLDDAIASNAKYLEEDGNSKIIEVTGTVAAVNEDMNKQKTILLKEEGEGAGVNCTFTLNTNAKVEEVHVGDKVTIKGLFKSGAEFDEDMEEYLDVNLSKCDIIK